MALVVVMIPGPVEMALVLVVMAKLVLVVMFVVVVVFEVVLLVVVTTLVILEPLVMAEPEVMALVILEPLVMHFVVVVTAGPVVNALVLPLALVVVVLARYGMEQL